MKRYLLCHILNVYLFQFFAFLDDNFLGGSAAVRAELLNSVDDVLSSNDLSEDDVSAVEPWGLSNSDEELTSIGVLSSVGHGEAALEVLQLEVFIREFRTVDALATGTVTSGEIATFGNELARL